MDERREERATSLPPVMGELELEVRLRRMGQTLPDTQRQAVMRLLRTVASAQRSWQNEALKEKEVGAVPAVQPDR